MRRQAGSSCLSPTGRDPARGGHPAGRRRVARRRAGPAQAHPGRSILVLHRRARRRVTRRTSTASTRSTERPMTTVTAGAAAYGGRTVPAYVSIATITARNLRRLVRVPTLL